MLLRELGNSCQIRRETLRTLFGERYIDALEGMQREGFIQQSLDDMNPSVHVIRFLQPGLDCVARREEQKRKQLQAAEQAALNQAGEDAVTLLKYFNVTQPGKAYAITPEKLTKILGSPIQRRLDYLVKGHYLTMSEALGEYKLSFLAKSLELLPEQLEEPRLVHRQVTVDGQRIDLRSMVGQVLATPNIANLADACRVWLADLKYERPTARRKVRILLERAIGIRGTDLAAYDPELKAEIMKVLTSPSLLSGSGKVRGRERR